MEKLGKEIDFYQKSDGCFETHTLAGGYPLFYFNQFSMILCPSCADINLANGAKITYRDINWENSSLYCSRCSKQIESAYGDDQLPE